MTSIRKLAANRTNARASTGPRTAAGRARSSGNALRHGLAATRTDAAAAEEVEALARVIAEADANAEIIERARDVAQAHAALARVDRARRVVLAEVLCPPDQHGAEAQSAATEAETACAFANRLMQRMRNLRAFDRYEQAAVARRRLAIRALDEARRRQADAGQHYRPDVIERPSTRARSRRQTC